MKVQLTSFMTFVILGWVMSACHGGDTRADAANIGGRSPSIRPSDPGAAGAEDAASETTLSGSGDGAVVGGTGWGDMTDARVDEDTSNAGGDSDEADAATSHASAGGMGGGRDASGGTAGSSMDGPTASAGTSGTASTSCPFPSSFKWTSSGPLAEPKSPPGHNFACLKDFTVVKWQNMFVVYATVYDTKSTYSGVNIDFTDWSKMATADQIWMETTPAGATVSPSLIYLTPKNQWVLTFQWGFKYATSSDPTQPSKWSAPKSLFASRVANSETGPMDPTVICDSARCYLFFTASNGNIYRSSMPIDNFPSTFTSHETIWAESNKYDAFEAVQVYAVKGTGKYLMVVGAIGPSGQRYFRAFSADSLGGKFTPIPGASSEAKPFAGKNNVTFSGTPWTNDIGQGDIVRENPSETQTIDPCNLQFLYQGRDPTKVSSNDGEMPYRPGLLTLVR